MDETTSTAVETKMAPRERVAVFLADHRWWDGVGVRDARRGEQRSVAPGSGLAVQIDAGTAPAAWLEDAPRVMPCPRCGRPLDKAVVRADPPVMRNLMRATCDVCFMWHHQFLSARAGELPPWPPHVMQAAVEGCLPGTFVETRLHRYRTTCPSCRGVVEIVVDGD